MSPRIKKKNLKDVENEVKRSFNKGAINKNKFEHFRKKMGVPKSGIKKKPLLKKQCKGKKKIVIKAKRSTRVTPKTEKMFSKAKIMRTKDIKCQVGQRLKKRKTGKGKNIPKTNKVPKNECAQECNKKLNCVELIPVHADSSKSIFGGKTRKLKTDNTAIVSVPKFTLFERRRSVRKSSFRIKSLPDNILLKIFSYFSQNEFCRLALVCKKWHNCTKNPVLWENVELKFRRNCGSVNEVVSTVFEKIPSQTSRISLNFTDPMTWRDRLQFEEFCQNLSKIYPRLQSLFLTSTKISLCLQSAMDACVHFLPDLKVLSFQRCYFGVHIFKGDNNDISNIKTLIFRDIDFDNKYLKKLTFSKMPYLKKLYLQNTNLADVWFYDISLLYRLEALSFDVGWNRNFHSLFDTLVRYASNLTELYLCWTEVCDNNFRFKHFPFPQLKTICIFATQVSGEGTLFLFQSCPSIETIYIDERVVESYINYVSYFPLNKCPKNVIKGVSTCHH